ncbi:hypothetical protein SAY86_013834 [Trapa natans]|uniref:Uncharacterized protein n=1 Tax=Trapa natans TaxID=22666 RepID=A0AAN7KT23_TRANT|nr:hypothetical protein SAY86_013834 [Trapa natans]
MELETVYMGNPYLSSNWLFFSEWTREENKLFEWALAVFDEETPQRWANIAAMIPGKSELDVMTKYKELEEDLMEIEAGKVPFPWRFGPSFSVEERVYGGIRRRGPDHERKKGVPWTEEEHRRFLQGLLKYGKGDWRSISRDFVVSKTPTQVASHAQKYFIRQQLSTNSNSRDGRRRPSIHDITIRSLANSSLQPSENSTDNLTDSSSSIRQFQELKPELVVSWPDNPSLWDVAPVEVGLQGMDLPLAAFGRFGLNSQINSTVAFWSTRHRICG